MKASVIFAAKRPFEVCDVTVDKPAPHEVLVRIGASGLCHSDYHFASGDLPFAMPAIFGHEAAGIVEAVGSEVTTVAIGDHVVACAASFCGRCNPCVSGRNHLCTNKPRRGEKDEPRLVLPNGAQVHQGASIGGFAEQILVHENAIVRLPRELPLDRAALLGCGVLTGLGAVFNSARVSAGSAVAVIGCGGFPTCLPTQPRGRKASCSSDAIAG
jgi:S-(hydroxymethyl)glutathione dehydrogenase/alcohol dehydrogenase